MMEEWREYKLGEVCSRLKSGKSIPAKCVSKEGTYPVIGGNGVRGYAESSNFKGDCCVIGRQGAYCGNVRYFRGEAHMTEHAVVVIGNDLANTRYLSYLLSLKNLGQLSSQSAQPGLSIQTLSNVDIELPSVIVQRKIASILSSLDDKIELNRRINANLEEQAQALFKSWFIDFEPFKDGKFVDLGNVIATRSGGTPSRKTPEFYQDAKIKWVKSKELNSNFIIDTEEKINEDAIKMSAAKILPKDSVLIAMYGATVGEYGIIDEPMACNQAVCALIPNECYPYTYLFMFAKNSKERLVNSAIGSAQQNISQVLIRQMKVSSDIDLISKYNNITYPLFENIRKNSKEIQHLSTLRDTLLPKLMSGEIEI